MSILGFLIILPLINLFFVLMLWRAFWISKVKANQFNFLFYGFNLNLVLILLIIEEYFIKTNYLFVLKFFGVFFLIFGLMELIKKPLIRRLTTFNQKAQDESHDLVEFFTKKFQHKTNQELQIIAEDPKRQKDAREAATVLLSHRSSPSI